MSPHCPLSVPVTLSVPSVSPQCPLTIPWFSLCPLSVPWSPLHVPVTLSVPWCPLVSPHSPLSIPSVSPSLSPQCPVTLSVPSLPSGVPSVFPECPLVSPGVPSLLPCCHPRCPLSIPSVSPSLSPAVPSVSPQCPCHPQRPLTVLWCSLNISSVSPGVPWCFLVSPHCPLSVPTVPTVPSVSPLSPAVPSIFPMSPHCPTVPSLSPPCPQCPQCPHCPLSVPTVPSLSPQCPLSVPTVPSVSPLSPLSPHRSFGCSSLAERDRWIEELRRAARPDKDNCERQELALTLWVYEGRDLPPRRRLRCHLQLDGATFARTTAKPAGADGQLFWGELFQLAALPPARALTVALCRDDHPGQPLATVTVPLAELAAARQPLERWYTLGGAGGERAPAVRLRGRYREVRVLPIVRYKELAEFITFHYRELCGRLEPAIAVRHKEELAGALVRVLQSTGKAKSFLIDLGMAELDRFDDHEALIFRENTLATKAIDEYMKLVGAKYLQDTLGEVVAQLCSSEESSEVDPSRCSGLELPEHRQHLRQVCEETLRRITDGSESFPAELAEVFAAWRGECAARGKAAIGQRLVSASLFLRFLCPAIMSPSLFGLVQEYPGEATARTLTLVAKVIQNLANFTTFGEKEPYMTFMNDFLEHNWATMTEFLAAVATPEASVHMATYDGSVDLALELATLHLLLCDIFSSLDQATQEELEPLPTILRAIREGTPVPVSWTPVPLSPCPLRSLTLYPSVPLSLCPLVPLTPVPLSPYPFVPLSLCPPSLSPVPLSPCPCPFVHLSPVPVPIPVPVPCPLYPFVPVSPVPLSLCPLSPCPCPFVHLSPVPRPCPCPPVPVPLSPCPCPPVPVPLSLSLSLSPCSCPLSPVPVPLSLCPSVLYPCPSVPCPLSLCPPVPLSLYPFVPCPSVPLSLCPPVLCPFVPLSICPLSLSLSPCPLSLSPVPAPYPLFPSPYPFVPLSPCPPVPLSPCPFVPCPRPCPPSAPPPPKPGFVPPRDLLKRGPLIKSQSLTSVRRVRGEGTATATATATATDPSPEPEPSPEPSSVPIPAPNRQRRHVQRTQSVPAQPKTPRGQNRGDRDGHATQGTARGGTGTEVNGDGPVRTGGTGVGQGGELVALVWGQKGPR
uniref:RAS protein activator like 3 n=1 Tax=Catharus ustulatus TaxID=91951 RepID=A0A8C3UIB3_CATUS